MEMKIELKRKIYDKILKWKQTSDGSTALMIEGARRVGKSHIAEEFARAEYKSYILIDFNKASNEVKELFNNYLDDLDTFFMYLSAYYNIKLYPRKSLIIFDEVQLFPRARSAIKFFVEDGRYDYIETGSLVSIKSSKRYTLTSLKKFMKRYKENLHIPYVLHSSDLKVEDGITYLPLYMTPLL